MTADVLFLVNGTSFLPCFWLSGNFVGISLSLVSKVLEILGSELTDPLRFTTDAFVGGLEPMDALRSVTYVFAPLTSASEL